MSSFRRALLLLAIVTLPDTAAASDQRWHDDYQNLKQAMEVGYANLPWFASIEGGADLPRLDRLTRKALDEAETEKDARTAIRHFVEAFGDGHFSVLPQRDPPAPTPAIEPPVRSLGGLSAREACAALGYANRSQVAFSVPFESLIGFTLLDDGKEGLFRAGILRFDGRQIAVIRIANFSPTQYPVACEAAWRVATPAQRDDDGEFSDLVQAEWLRGLAATIARLAASHPDAMLVDVGTNSGGNDSGDWAARLFTERPLRSARMLMPATLATRYVDVEGKVLSNTLADADPASARAGRNALATFATRRQAAANAACDMSWVWRERRAWRSGGCDGLADVGFASGLLVDYQAPKAIRDEGVARQMYWPSWVDAWIGSWRGRTYVFTNTATYSSAEMFAAILQNNDAAKTVGSRTGGDGCGFALSVDPITLPALGMQIRMPNCLRLRADGGDEVAGVMPDIPVASRQGQSNRMRAAEVAAAIAGDLGNSAQD